MTAGIARLLTNSYSLTGADPVSCVSGELRASTAFSPHCCGTAAKMRQQMPTFILPIFSGAEWGADGGKSESTILFNVQIFFIVIQKYIDNSGPSSVIKLL